MVGPRAHQAWAGAAGPDELSTGRGRFRCIIVLVPLETGGAPSKAVRRPRIVTTRPHGAVGGGGKAVQGRLTEV